MPCSSGCNCGRSNSSKLKCDDTSVDVTHCLCCCCRWYMHVSWILSRKCTPPTVGHAIVSRCYCYRCSVDCTHICRMSSSMTLRSTVTFGAWALSYRLCTQSSTTTGSSTQPTAVALCPKALVSLSLSYVKFLWNMYFGTILLVSEDILKSILR